MITKEAIKGSDIELIISVTKGADSADVLLHRMKNLKENKNVVSFTQEKFFKTYRKKIADATNNI